MNRSPGSGSLSPQYIAPSPSDSSSDTESYSDQKTETMRDVEVVYEEIQVEQEVFAVYRKEKDY